MKTENRSPNQTIPDKLCQEIEHLVNCTIHELVFLQHHVADDQEGDALNCLTAVTINLERVAELLAGMDAKANGVA